MQQNKSNVTHDSLLQTDPLDVALPFTNHDDQTTTLHAGLINRSEPLPPPTLAYFFVFLSSSLLLYRTFPIHHTLVCDPSIPASTLRNDCSSSQTSVAYSIDFSRPAWFRFRIKRGQLSRLSLSFFSLTPNPQHALTTLTPLECIYHPRRRSTLNLVRRRFPLKAQQRRFFIVVSVCIHQERYRRRYFHRELQPRR